MLNLTFTGTFKKERKLIKKRNKDMDKLSRPGVKLTQVGENEEGICTYIYRKATGLMVTFL
jgi:hypothetical protein